MRIVTKIKRFLGIDPLGIVIRKGEQHSLSTHGDMSIHLECGGCRAIALEACRIAGVTPEQYRESFIPGSPTYLDEPRDLSQDFVNKLFPDKETP